MRNKVFKGIVTSLLISMLSTFPVYATEITTEGSSPFVVTLVYEGQNANPVALDTHVISGIKVVYTGGSIDCDKEIDKTKLTVTYLYTDTYSDGSVVTNVESNDVVPTANLTITHGTLKPGVNTFTVSDSDSGKSATFTTTCTNPERERTWNGIVAKYTYGQLYTTDTVNMGLVTIYKTVSVRYADGSTKTVTTTDKVTDAFLIDHLDVKVGLNTYTVTTHGFTGTFTLTGVVKEEPKQTQPQTQVTPAPATPSAPITIVPVPFKPTVVPEPQKGTNEVVPTKPQEETAEQVKADLEKEMTVKVELGGQIKEEIIKDNDDNCVIRNAGDILSEIIDDDDIEAYKNGVNISVVVNITDKSLPSKNDLLAIAEGLPSTYQAGTTFTVSIDKLYDGEIKTSYTTFNKPIVVSVPIPGEVLGANRKVALMGIAPTDADNMYKVHYFEDLDDVEDTITFETEDLETYVFIYEEVALSESIPTEAMDDKLINIEIRYKLSTNTSVKRIVFVAIGLLVIIVAMAVVVYLKARSNDDE